MSKKTHKTIEAEVQIQANESAASAVESAAKAKKDVKAVVAKFDKHGRKILGKKH